MAGCGGQAGTGPAGAAATPPAAPVASNAGATVQSQAAMTPSTAGADLTSFDACSVVNDDEYKSALNTSRVQEGGTAEDTIVVRHEVITDTFSVGGLPVSKACKQLWSSPEGGRGEMNILFYPYDLLSLWKSTKSYHEMAGYEAASAGTIAFNCFGSVCLNKSGYLFTVNGGSGMEQVYKTMLIDVANRLPAS